MPLGFPLPRRSRLLNLCCAALTFAVGIGALGATSTAAQFRDVTPVDRLVVGQQVNAFVPWDGARLDGLDVEIPAGWSLQAVRAIPDGTLLPVDLRIASTGPETFRAVAPRPLRGPVLLVARFKTGSEAEWTAVRFSSLLRTPEGLTESGSSSVRWRPSVGARQRRVTGRGFQSDRPLALSARALPSLGPNQAFTIETWLKTTALSEVVLSSWSGREGEPYVAEFTVDARGHLAVFRGTNGRHRSLISPAPVADGLWHHVALVQSPDDGMLRLLVDGSTADSLRLDAGASIRPYPIGLGGRIGRDLEEDAPAQAFSGLLDEVRFWDEARSEQAIRRTRRRTLNPVGGERPAVQFTFERPIPDAFLSRPAGSPYRVPSDLSFSFPIEHLSADLDGSVVAVTWETMDRENTAFVVERSADGRRFDEVGRVRLADRVAEAADGAMRFQLADLPPAEERVAYYRVRQRFDGGPDRVSGAVKVGLGAAAGPESAIVHAAPNPFADATSIRFALAEAGRARLSVWDVSGQQVALLTDGVRTAGEHEIPFDAGALPSGLYFARLQTPGGSDTFKLTITR